MTNQDAQIVENAGLYLPCFRFSLLGWNAKPTARTDQGIDIVAYIRSGSGHPGVQAKTLSKRDPVTLRSSFNKIMGDYWIIVSDVLAGPAIFVLRPDKVRERAHRGDDPA